MNYFVSLSREKFKRSAEIEGEESGDENMGAPPKSGGARRSRKSRANVPSVEPNASTSNLERDESLHHASGSASGELHLPGALGWDDDEAGPLSQGRGRLL